MEPYSHSSIGDVLSKAVSECKNSASEGKIGPSGDKVAGHVSKEKTSQEANSESNMTLPINTVNYKGIDYDMSQPITNDSQLVKKQAEIIENDLKIATLGRDLSSLGKFVHLAYCGVVGHTELQIKTREILINVGGITDDTYHALKDFETTSRMALQTMQTAYRYLMEGLEEEAFKMFSQIQNKSEKMYKISENLAKKCKNESKIVGQLEVETLKEKNATEKMKRETDKLASKNKIEKHFHENEMKESLEEVNKKKNDIANLSDDEKNILKDRKELTESTEKKLQKEFEIIRQHKVKLRSNYDHVSKDIEKRMQDRQWEFEKKLLSNTKSYEKALEDINATLKVKLNIAEIDYEKKIKENEEEFSQAKEKYDNLCEHKIKEYKEKHTKLTIDTEKAYEVNVKKIDDEYQDAIQAINDELNRKLTLAKQKLETELQANKHKYNAKIKTCRSDKIKAHEKWSKTVAEAKSKKSEKENSAKSDNIKAQKTAKETKENKLNAACKDKEVTIEEAKKEYKFTMKEIDKEYHNAVQASEEEFNNRLTLATQTLREELEANERKYSAKTKAYWTGDLENDSEAKAHEQAKLEESEKEHQVKINEEYPNAMKKSDKDKKLDTQNLKGDLEANDCKSKEPKDCSTDEAYEQWSISDAKAKRIKSEADFSAKSDNTETRKKVKETRQKKLSTACKDKEVKIKEAEETYQATITDIDREYHDAIQDSDKELQNKLDIVTQTLKSELEANERQYSEKARSCWTSWGAARIHKEWSKIDTDARNTKSESEECARSNNNKAYKTANETRQKKLKIAHDNVTKQIEEAEKTYLLNLTKIDEEYHRAIQVIDNEFKSKLTSAMQTLKEELVANEKEYIVKTKNALIDQAKVNEEWSKSDAVAKYFKSESEQATISDCIDANKIADEIKQNKLNLAAEEKSVKIYQAERAYEFIVEKIEEQHQGSIQAIDNDFSIKLTKAEQILQTAKDANKCKYSAKLKACWTSWGETRTHNKWSRKDADAESNKKGAIDSAESDKTRVKNVATEAKESMLNTACESKEKGIEEIETSYKMRIDIIEKEYCDVKNSNDNNLTLRRQATVKKTEEKLESNKRKYSIKAKKCLTDEARAQEEWSKSDAEAKSNKSKSENLAKYAKNEAQKMAKETREKNSNIASKDKETKIHKAEEACELTIKKLDEEYHHAIQASDEEYKSKLTSAAQTFKEEIEANDRKFSAIEKACTTDEAKIHEEWSESDTIARSDKSKIELSAKSEKIEAQKAAKETRQKKLNTAYEHKEATLKEAEKVLNQNVEEAIEKKNELNTKATQNQKDDNAAAKSNKETAIFDAEKEKEIAESKVNENKKVADKSAEDIKKSEDEVDKNKQQHYFHIYQLDLKQKEKDFEVAKLQINDEYLKQLKIIDDNLKQLREKREQYESDIKNLQKKREDSFQKILHLAQQIDLNEVQETSVECLHQAVSALHNIQDIMRSAGNFWQNVGRHCNEIAEDGVNSQFEMMQCTDSSTRQKMWKGNTFKQVALLYQGQWVSLKDKCALASEKITLVQDEINLYIRENPTKNEAIVLVKKLASDLMNSHMLADKAAKMVTDKPVEIALNKPAHMILDRPTDS